MVNEFFGKLSKLCTIVQKEKLFLSITNKKAPTTMKTRCLYKKMDLHKNNFC